MGQGDGRAASREGLHRVRVGHDWLPLRRRSYCGLNAPLRGIPAGGGSLTRALIFVGGGGGGGGGLSWLVAEVAAGGGLGGGGFVSGGPQGLRTEACQKGLFLRRRQDAKVRAHGLGASSGRIFGKLPLIGGLTTSGMQKGLVFPNLQSCSLARSRRGLETGAQVWGKVGGGRWQRARLQVQAYFK